MALRFYDFKCDDCGEKFEALLGSADEARECPKCGCARSTLQPTLQISFRTSGRGRVIDMSSNSCPCGARGAHKH